MEETSTYTLVARVEWIREVVADGCGLQSELHREVCAALAIGDRDSLMGVLMRWIAMPHSERLAILERGSRRLRPTATLAG
jgi:hypothetical protein